MTIAEILSKELDAEQIFWEDEDTLEEAKNYVDKVLEIDTELDF